MMPKDERTAEELEAEAQGLEEPVAPPEVPVELPPEPAPMAPVDVELPEPSEKRWTWVGDKEYSGGEEGDGISDLFRVRDEEISDDVESATALDYEEDVLDAGEDGTIDDVVSVDEEDIMGGDGEGDDDDIIGVDEEEDLSDLFDLDNVASDPFGRSRSAEPPAVPNRARRVRRTWKPYKPYSGLQGVQ